MKKMELVYNEILYEVIEKSNRKLTQLSLAKKLDISLSTVNLAIAHLDKINSIKKALKYFIVTDPKRILLYWASIRNLEKDIIYKTRVEKGVTQIEKNMPSDIIYGAYSAYKFTFKDIPADYSEVYVYSNNLAEIKKRFPENKNPPNLFVLKKDISKMTKANIFVDIWNLKEWYAREFLKALEDRLYGVLE